jgi:glycosyltransferase involved in cell wall biosynthesis
VKCQVTDDAEYERMASAPNPYGDGFAARRTADYLVQHHDSQRGWTSMRVAIIDEELPYPLNSGKRIRTFQLVSRLARRHQITYICHQNADQQEAVQAEVALCRLGVNTVVGRPVPPKSGPAFHARLAASVFSPLPYSVASHRSYALSRAIRQVAAREEIDLWQAEWTPYAESFHVLGHVPRLIMAHNVESQIWRRYYESEANPLKRWYIGHQWRKFEKFERRAFQQVDRIIAVSPEDAALIRDHFGAPHVDVVENGVDTTYFRPDGSDRDPGRLTGPTMGLAMAGRGRRLAEEQYDWEILADRLDRIWAVGC